MRTLIGVDDPITVRERRRLVLRHTFSGASLTPSDQGPSFSVSEFAPSVSGGVMAMGASQPIGVFASGVGANLVAQMKVNFGNSAGADRRASIQIRASAYNGNVIEALLSRSADQIALWRRDAGAVTTLAAVNSAGLADSTDYWLRIVASGSNLQVLTSTDGSAFTSRITYSEPLYVANTGLGIRLVDNGTRTITVDDLRVWTP